MIVAEHEYLTGGNKHTFYLDANGVEQIKSRLDISLFVASFVYMLPQFVSEHGVAIAYLCW